MIRTHNSNIFYNSKAVHIEKFSIVFLLIWEKREIPKKSFQTQKGFYMSLASTI